MGGRVIFGAVVIAFGFLIANLLARLIAGDAGGTTAATIVRWATIILFVFMGLQFTGIGGMIPANALTILIAENLWYGPKIPMTLKLLIHVII